MATLTTTNSVHKIIISSSEILNSTHSKNVLLGLNLISENMAIKKSKKGESEFHFLLDGNIPINVIKRILKKLELKYLLTEP